MRLAVGTLGGMLRITLPSNAYDGTGAASEPQTQESVFETHADDADAESRGHWEATGGKDRPQILQFMLTKKE